MVMPQIRNGSVGSLKFLNQATVLTSSNKVGCDESRGTVNLRNLICKHITIVVVCRHSESTVGPANQLHRGSIGDEMLKISSRTFQKTSLLKIGLVVFVEDFLHGFPEALLPLEDSLLGDNIWGNFGIKASLEEKVSQFCDVVVRIMVNDDDIVVIRQITLVNDEWRRTIIWKVSGQQRSLTNFVPSSTIFTSNGMTLKEDRILVSKFHSFNMDCVTRNSNSIPASSHGSIGRSKCLGKSHLLHLKSTGSNCWFLENGTDFLSSFDGVVENLVVTFVTSFARKIKVFPLLNVEVWLDPLVNDQVTGVVGHFFSSDVDHRRSFDSLVEGHAVIDLGGSA
mmetsp:Transcript_43790/g.105636  ORF Transcript_43790/g.105636 Transcript_43790/m.105636 type:complete len:338 (-) Transcript_43790:155-1168(-)